MKNPLNKRILKEIKGDIGKYLVLFLFMSATIGFISGFLVASSSMITAYEESFEKYNIEYGNFELPQEMTDSLKETLEREAVTIYDNWYIEEKVQRKQDDESTSHLRIYKQRKEINKECVMKGKLPRNDKEIAIDRMYAENNKIAIGDTLTIGGIEQKVSGYVALTDYSALYSDNNDMMFDAVKFGVAVVTEDCFTAYGTSGLHYVYSWKYDTEPKDEIEEKKMADDFMEVLYQNTPITNFIPRYSNQAIKFAGDDLGNDNTMMVMLLYILIAIIAFIFAVTTNNTISRESCIIGTLRASGYSRRELVFHYMSMPVIVTILAALVGNVAGYTFFKNIAASMYYGSYSLTKYETIWNSEAFLKTTIVPVCIVMVINFVILSSKMRIEPLRFIRNDLKKKNAKAIKLPNFKFIMRFRMRIIFQNISAYIMLFIGICFANIILLFGMMMTPLLDKYQDKILDNMIAQYQYVLKAPVETKTERAEKFGMYALETTGNRTEGISIYGIQEDSRYVDTDFKKNKIYISNSYADKYLIEVGDKLTLKEKYSDKSYEFTVDGIYDYPASLAIFMPLEQFCETFDYEDGYFNGYFSDKEIKDINKQYIATKITEEELTKTTRQMDISMGKKFYIVNLFSVILFMLLIFLLSKLVIEKNTNAISMVKILGYENKEIKKLYLTATTMIVAISIAVSLPVATFVIEKIYRTMMVEFTGWLPIYISAKTYVEIFLIGIISYLLIERILYKRIQKIPMDQALKNVE